VVLVQPRYLVPFLVGVRAAALQVVLDPVDAHLPHLVLQVLAHADVERVPHGADHVLVHLLRQPRQYYQVRHYVEGDANPGEHQAASALPETTAQLFSTRCYRQDSTCTPVSDTSA
jgi:hypothetical protein